MERYIEKQQENTVSAYDNADIDYSERVLEQVVNKGIKAKSAINIPEFAIYERKYTEEELIKFHGLKTLIDQYPETAFNFSGLHATERETGNCQPLKKFLKSVDYGNTQQILDMCQMTKTLFVAKNPWFLLFRGEFLQSAKKFSQGYEIK